MYASISCIPVCMLPQRSVIHQIETDTPPVHSGSEAESTIQMPHRHQRSSQQFDTAHLAEPV